HPHIRATFGDEYNCVFPKHLSVMLARRLKSAPGVNAFIFWGKRDKYDKLERCARERNIPIHWMEDGFLRSVRLGAERIPALSLVLDKRGIYFDAGAESDLEHLLQNHDFHADPQLIPRARKAMEKMISSALSKYNHAAVKQLGTAPGGEAAGKKRILVIGQV